MINASFYADPTPPAAKLRRLLAIVPRWFQHCLFTGLWMLIWLAVIAAPILIYAGAIQLTGNIDTVEPGKVYRSATLSGPELSAFIRDKQIRTVINLRGENANQTWYQDEVRVTRDARVTRIDLPMSAIHEPDAELLGKLITALETSATPMLIHCSSGSDRTGLAAALYEMLVMKKPANEARGQLSFYWGHFPWIVSPTIAMDRTFDGVVAGRMEQ